ESVPRPSVSAHTLPVPVAIGLTADDGGITIVAATLFTAGSTRRIYDVSHSPAHRLPKANMEPGHGVEVSVMVVAIAFVFGSTFKSAAVVRLTIHIASAPAIKSRSPESAIEASGVNFVSGNRMGGAGAGV